MDFIITFLKNPITIAAIAGLVVGLLLSLVILIKTRIYRREIEDELADSRYDNRRLEEQMNTQMRVSAKKQEELLQTIESQRVKIENLQATLDTLNTKAGKKELRKLSIMQHALELMEEDSPNAMLSWENAHNKATEEMAQVDRGLKPMLKKFLKTE